MDASEARLWGRWTGEGDTSAREALILLHAKWARLVARDVFVRVRSRNTEWREFTQNATLGLIEALDSFDPARGVEFRSFARHRVRGAVFNGLRQLWHRGAAVQSPVDADRTESLIDDGTDPLESFVSWTIGSSIGYLLDVTSLPEAASVPQGPYAVVESDQRAELLRRLIELLPEREGMVMTMHYFQHVSFVEIAGFLGVTKGRVSQLHKQGIARLRECLREYSDDLAC